MSQAPWANTQASLAPDIYTRDQIEAATIKLARAKAELQDALARAARCSDYSSGKAADARANLGRCQAAVQQWQSILTHHQAQQRLRKSS